MLVFCIYLAIALYAYRHLLNGSSLPACACGDQAQEVSFLAWGSFAVTHGHNPFFTVWTNYPTGMNLAVNTSFPLLSFIAIPAVLTIGPVASYILLLVAGFALSALAMYVLLRRWVRWSLAAFIGGLLYGFSPYMIGQGWGHLFLIFVPIPPLIFLVLDEILVRQSHNVRWLGVALGALAAAQYYISPEVLTLTAVVAGIGTVILAAMHRRSVTSCLTYVLRGFGYAVLVCAPLNRVSCLVRFLRTGSYRRTTTCVKHPGEGPGRPSGGDRSNGVSALRPSAFPDDRKQALSQRYRRERHVPGNPLDPHRNGHNSRMQACSGNRSSSS